MFLRWIIYFQQIVGHVAVKCLLYDIYIVAFIPGGRKYERKCGIISTSIIGSPLKPIRLCVYIFSFPVSLSLSLSHTSTHTYRYIKMSSSKSHEGHYLCKKGLKMRMLHDYTIYWFLLKSFKTLMPFIG